MILYKYTTAQIGKQILLDSTIRFTQLMALNDPFESIPSTPNIINKDLLEQTLEMVLADNDLLNQVIVGALSDMYDKFPVGIQAIMSKETFITFGRKYFPDQASKYGVDFSALLRQRLSEDSNNIVEDTRKKFNRFFTSNICVLSLTELNNNKLMWAHYSDASQGIVIGFDTSFNFFSNLIHIEYASERPIIPALPKIPTEEDRLRLVKMLVGTKNIEWKHEKEYRIVLPVALLHETGQIDDRGFQIFVADLPRSCISEVIFGTHVQRQSYLEIKSILEFDNNRHIKLFQASIQEGKYDLVVEPINKLRPNQAFPLDI
jgi:hypothetical protein